MICRENDMQRKESEKAGEISYKLTEQRQHLDRQEQVTIVGYEQAIE